VAKLSYLTGNGKSILKETVDRSRKNWSLKLDHTLWAYQTVYKTPLGITPYCLVFENSCHLPVELEHKAYWVIKMLNFDLKVAGKKRSLQLYELDKLMLEAYESSRIYKEKTKQWHDKHIFKKRFEEGHMVLLFNSKLKLFSGKLRS